MERRRKGAREGDRGHNKLIQEVIQMLNYLHVKSIRRAENGSLQDCLILSQCRGDGVR